VNVLITTEPNDIHAIHVKLALENKGHRCVLWFIADMPTQQFNSIYCSNDNDYWLTESNTQDTIKITDDAFDVVWWRRPRRPYIPTTHYQHDLDFIKKENSLFYDSISVNIAKNAWWINPSHAIKYANSKIYQLKLAYKCGFKIPATLISNSPKLIKEFLIKYQRKVIYKPFQAHHWLEGDCLKFSYTNKIDLDNLPCDQLLQIVPGIYQQQLIKKYELRITCFGDHLVAIKIASQQHLKGLNDWRVIPSNELLIEPYRLSQSIEKKIRLFMRQLDIVFGCFDIVVDVDDDIYFLEVNQQGQFLWIEDCLPEIKMLDKFVKFILAKTIYFNWDNLKTISLKDDQSNAYQLNEKYHQQHIYLNKIKNIT
jgi:glutathione synthase/RimK-type ligase-like ATP-grasp enzyme